MNGRADDVTASWGAQCRGWGVLVHGGAGDLSPENALAQMRGCRAAVAGAEQVLRAGGSALDAVERAVIALEDDPNFNAGTGACLNADGLIELDALLMEGKNLRAGGVCALPPFLNPIAIARAVLDDGRHVLYAGHGAARFAAERGFAPSTHEAMTTETARARWAASRATLDRSVGNTVGAVARDALGTVAAATSTGGRVNKLAGRVGDTPIPGAGTYADDDAGACSATGEGEAIMRVALARGAVDLLRARIHPEDAARSAIGAMAARVGGSGGIILIDRLGRLGLARNTRSMTWAVAGEGLDANGGS
jgi:beta-aspartyl-peptidase (threonine type)